MIPHVLDLIFTEYLIFHTGPLILSFSSEICKFKECLPDTQT